MSKFEALYKKIINENEQSHSIDPRGMLDSIGWQIDVGLLDISDISAELASSLDNKTFDVESWMEKNEVKVVTFADGAKEVWNYAKEYDATHEELNDLKAKLIELGKTHKGKTFFTYGIEADVSLGVI